MKPITMKELAPKVAEGIERSTSKHSKTVIGCGKGVLLVIQPSGKADYYARHVQPNGKRTLTRLGAYDKMTLESARDKAQKLQAKARKGREATREEATKAPKLGDFYGLWIEKKKTEGVEYPRIRALCLARDRLAPLHEMRLDEITPLVMKAHLDQLNLGPFALYVCVQAFNQMMKYAVNVGAVKSNPCAFMLIKSEGVYKRPEVGGIAWVPPEELKSAFFEPLAQVKSVKTKVYWLVIAYTLLRRHTVNCMHWDWIDWGDKVIHVPAENMKMRRAFDVPITEQICRLLRLWQPLTQGSPFVFPGTRNPAKPMCTEVNLIAKYCQGKCTLHGLRKTGRTWFQAHRIPFEVAEAVLSHEEQSVVVRTYAKYDYFEEKLEALTAWDKFVDTCIPANYLPELGIGKD